MDETATAKAEKQLIGESPAQAPSLFRVDVGGWLGGDFVPMANDVLRMLCIQVSIQLMLVLAGGGGAAAMRFLSSDFLLLVFYITLGVMLYWLAIRKLVVFV